MRTIELSNQDDIFKAQKEQRAKIVNAYKKAKEEDFGAEMISKADFQEKYPLDKFEIYSLQSVHKFREDLIKAEGIEDKNAAFKQATSGLKSFVVTENGQKWITFVRQKEAGE